MLSAMKGERKSQTWKVWQKWFWQKRLRRGSLWKRERMKRARERTQCVLSSIRPISTATARSAIVTPNTIREMEERKRPKKSKEGAKERLEWVSEAKKSKCATPTFAVRCSSSPSASGSLAPSVNTTSPSPPSVWSWGPALLGRQETRRPPAAVGSAPGRRRPRSKCLGGTCSLVGPPTACLRKQRYTDHPNYCIIATTFFRSSSRMLNDPWLWVMHATPFIKPAVSAQKNLRANSVLCDGPLSLEVGRLLKISNR